MKVRKLVGTSVAATTVAAGLLLSAAPSSAADSVAAKMYVDGYQTKDHSLKRANGRPWTEAQLALNAYLMSPAGGYGPSFLVLENYKVIRRYNMSDLYAVFIGNLADRIAGGGDFVTPWGGTGPQKTKNIEEIQDRLKGLGYDVEKIDGKVGSNTRKVIGLYERANNLKVDCWPSDAVLDHMRRTAAR